MGKPRMIILIRHAQSEGNKNRDIHQTVPDHRVKLTQDGWKQAAEAGIKLRSLLRRDDTLHFFTSPYRRTRETTEGILNTLTADTPNPSPFPRNTIKVYEEPRLREQDFGNFQPDSTEMARMWQERANYGHFFYRIPNGESAADAYDRVSGFNESLWRSFGEENFASVCVLVTHGLMTRVFLMKWYHFSVEYFEDLRNVNHCEFVVMKLNQDSGKFILQNQLRTWSQLKREREEAAAPPESPIPVRKRWGDSQDSCNADGFERRQLARRQNTADLFMDEVQLAQIESVAGRRLSRAAETEKAMDKKQVLSEIVESTGQEGNNQPPSNGAAAIQSPPSTPRKRILSPRIAATLHQSYDGGGLWSGSDSVANSSEDENSEIKERIRSLPVRSSMAMALHGELDTHGGVKERVRADALGDQSDVDDDDVEEEAKGERSLRSC